MFTNWALIYRDGRTPELAPVYDFHSLTVYQQYLNGEALGDRVRIEDLRRVAEGCGADPDQTARTAAAATADLREAWQGGLRTEAQARFPLLATHFSYRLDTLPVCNSS